ncbi:MAG: zinc-dependent alcohol dehydrogenase family protein [Rhodospirillales bacterium]|nr:zinc-dependent alcohol dehydrogenase family protein [Rhodospirillales bacterium]
MKVVRFSDFGPPHEVCECVDVDEPDAPGADEALVEVVCFPINPVDMLSIAGEYAVRPPLPANPGSEGVARVVTAGAEVTHVKPGDLVLLLGRENWMQRKVVKGAELLKLPEGIDVRQAAMLKINPATALLMLERYVDLKAGDWVIQDAANSGVGLNLIRIARDKGLRTVNVVRRESLIAPLMEIGADVVVVDGPDLADRVRTATLGGDIRLAVDAIAGPICNRLADCLGEGGVMVNYGLLSGKPCEVSPFNVTFRGIVLTGFWLVKHLGAMSLAEKDALYADLGGRVASGMLHVDVEAVYGMDDIRNALAHAGREARSGKILVAPNGPV